MTSYVYVGTPYSKYHRGIEAAYVEACKAAAALIKSGFNVFCPIAHTHGPAIFGGIDPLDHTIWMDADAPFIQGASALVVVKMTGWEESFGLQQEIQAFKAAGKPVLYMDWPA